jgi:hypothetical protein
MTEYSPFCVSRSVFRVLCFAFRVPRFVFRVSRFVFRVSYLKRFENLEFEI